MHLQMYLTTYYGNNIQTFEIYIKKKGCVRDAPSFDSALINETLNFALILIHEHCHVLFVGGIHSPFIFDHKLAHLLIVNEKHVKIIITMLKSMVPGIKLPAKDFPEALGLLAVFVSCIDDNVEHNVYLHTLLKCPEAILPSYFTNIICAFFNLKYEKIKYLLESNLVGIFI